MQHSFFGVGIIENGLHQTYKIAAIPNENIEKEEAELLKLAKALMPSFPYDEIDILIVDQMGKGNQRRRHGYQYHWTGFLLTRPPPKHSTHCRSRSFQKTGSNFYGIALADMVTRRLFNKISFEETYPNFITNVTPEGVSIPAVMDSDRLCLQACIKTCIKRGPHFPRIAWIQDTLHLGAFYISEQLYASPIAQGYTCTFNTTPLFPVFDENGILPALNAEQINKGWNSNGKPALEASGHAQKILQQRLDFRLTQSPMR